MTSRMDVSLLQLRAMQEVRKLLDEFYSSFEGEMQNGLVQNDLRGYMEQHSAEAMGQPGPGIVPGESEPVD